MKIVTGRNKPYETPAMKMIYGTHKQIETAFQDCSLHRCTMQTNQ